MALGDCHLLVLCVGLLYIGMTDACSVPIIATCYKCELPHYEIDTYQDNVADANACLALLTGSSYKTATFDASTGRCERGDTDQHLQYDNAATMVTFRETCNTDCPLYSWGYQGNTAFDPAPSGETGESRNECMVNCAETVNCRMLHHKGSYWYSSGDDVCGWKTNCDHTDCVTKTDYSYRMYSRHCYTGVDCGLATTAVSNGSATYSDTKPTDEGSTITYDCNTGYQKANSNTRTCTASGTWSTEVFTCDPKDCGNPAVQANGTWTYTTTTYLSTATLTCDTGYEIRRPSSSTTYTSPQTETCKCCKWSLPDDPAYWDRLYYCSIIQCPTPTLSNGDEVYPSRNFGDVVNYNCHTGYEMTSGDATRTCQASGSWSGTQPACSKKDCGAPPAPVDGSVSATLTTYNNNATYSCNTGYTMAGSSSRLCNSSGLWQGTAPTCQIVDCGVVTAPTNGNVNAPLTTYNEYATFTCDVGYNLNGASSIQCGSTALWSASVPTCDIVDCTGLSGITNGSVAHPLTTYGSQATYTCDTSYAISSGDETRTCQASGAWTGTQAVCTLIDCGTLTDPTNGSVSVLATTYDSDANYACDTGFDIQGTSVRTCNSSGVWSDTAPTCQIVVCPNVAAPTNGNVNAPLTTYTEYATFTCDVGYNLNGANSIQCESTALWSAPEPTCDIVDCTALPGITNGNVAQPLTTYGSQATYTCDTGYAISSGDETRTCQASGSWNGTEPTCTILDCGPVTDPTNGSVSASPTTFGSNANYNCDTGFAIQGTSVRTCNSSALWSDIAPTCQIVACPNVAAPTNGNVNAPLTTYTAYATFTCDVGYNLNGASSIQCGSTGTWIPSVPTCDIVDCTGLPGITNGNVAHPLTTYGSQATYTCDTGYFLSSGDETRTCQSSGSWNGTQAVCTILDCGSVTAPISGSVSASPTTYGSNANYNCDTGFVIQGTSVRTCNSSGDWSDIAPTCQIVDCFGLSAPTNGSVTVPLTTYGEQATFMCDNGYYVNGASILTCTSSGAWDASAPTCDLVDCGALPGITNGNVAHPLTTYGSQATYTCDTGYEISSGDETRTCQASGAWNGTEPTCTIVDCGSLLDPDNGTVSHPSTTYTSTATYSCDPGFNLNGASSRTCQADQQWSSTGPSCDQFDCGVVPSPTNGSVYINTTLYLGTAVYTCDPGNVHVGVQSRTCVSPGTWTRAAPTCVYVDCGTLTAPVNGYVAAADTFYGATANYSCDAGYQLNGTSWTACNESGNWDPADVPVCDAQFCPAPANQTHGWVETENGTMIGKLAVYDCFAGYDLNGTSTRECQLNLSWSGAEPTCDPRDCGPLAAPTHGSVSTPAGTVYPEVALYSCNTGYIMSGPSARGCQTNGTWNETEPSCTVADCGGVSPPVNGYVSTSGGTTYSKTAVYTCQAGYVTAGLSARVCQASGAWSGTPATCVAEDSVPPKIFIAPCICVQNKSFTNMTQDEIIDQLIKDTAIDLKDTATALAKLECREDPRASAGSLGLLGVGMICLVMAFIFSADFIRVCRWFSLMNRDRRYRAENEETPPEDPPE